MASTASIPHKGYNAFDEDFPISNNKNTSTTASSVSTFSHQMSPIVFEQLKQLPGNLRCVDCGSMAPDWGSPKLGILMCFQCSGRHRGLGVHLSFVRSVQMDHWEDSQIALMRVGGNDQCNEFLRSHGIAVANAPFDTSSSNNSDTAASAAVTTTSDPIADIRQRIIQEKYDSDAAVLYQQVLKAKVEGKPIPTQLEIPRPKNTSSISAPRRKMEGFGSGPPPPRSAASSPLKDVNTGIGAAAAVVCVTILGVVVWMMVPH